MMVLFVAVLSIGLAEGIPLYRKGQKKELVVMSCLLGAAILLRVADWFGLSSPVTLLDRLLGPVGKAVFK